MWPVSPQGFFYQFELSPFDWNWMLTHFSDNYLKVLLNFDVCAVDAGVPDEYLCPITREIMKDPVICAGERCILILLQFS